MELKLTKDQKELLTKVFREHISDLQREQESAKNDGISTVYYETEIANCRRLLLDILENS